MIHLSASLYYNRVIFYLVVNLLKWDVTNITNNNNNNNNFTTTNINNNI